MGDLERKISAVKRRMRLFRVLDWALWAMLFGLVLSALAVVALRLFPNSIDPLILSAAITGGLVLVAVIAACAKRLTKFEAAQHADSKLGLNERLSSALLLHEEGNEAPALTALEADAARYASQIQPGKDFRYRTPPHAKHVIWPLAAIFAVYFLMPQFDIFAGDQAHAKEVAKKTEMIPEEVAKEEARRMRELAKKAEATEEELGDAKDLNLAERLERLSRDLELNKKNKNEMVAEMSRLNDDISLRKKDITRKTQPFKQIKGLQNSDKTRDIQKNLKEQDFREAEQKMKDLAQMFQNKDLSSEEMQQVADEMKNLADEVKENKSLSDALDKAADAVENAAEKKKKQEEDQGSDQQQQQQGGQDQQQSQQSNDQGQQQSGQQSQQGDQQQPNQQNGGQQNQQGQSSQPQQQQAKQDAAAAVQQAAQQMGDMQQMMDQMQQLSQLQNSLNQSQQQCMNPQAGAGGQQRGEGQGGQQPSQGQQPSPGAGQQPQSNGMQPGAGQGQQEGGGGSSDWQQGDNQREGEGSGGPGQGNGGSPPDSGSMAMGFEDVFIPGQKNDGEIIAVFEIDAPASTGESNIDYSRVPTAYKQQAADTMNNGEIPAGYRNAVKDYFQSINFESEEE